MRLANLGQWAGPGTSLRPIGQHAVVPEHDENSGEADNRPNERIGAYGYQSQQTQECEILLTTRSLAPEAAALSFMQANRYDVRPHILLAMYGEDESAILACMVYGVRYLAAWCYSTRTARSMAAIECAAADALAVLHRRRAGMAADLRAKALGMRASHYRELRMIGLRMYRLRLQEACIRFHTGRIHTHRLP